MIDSRIRQIHFYCLNCDNSHIRTEKRKRAYLSQSSIQPLPITAASPMPNPPSLPQQASTLQPQFSLRTLARRNARLTEYYYMYYRTPRRPSPLPLASPNPTRSLPSFLPPPHPPAPSVSQSVRACVRASPFPLRPLFLHPAPPGLSVSSPVHTHARVVVVVVALAAAARTRTHAAESNLCMGWYTCWLKQTRES